MRLDLDQIRPHGLEALPYCAAAYITALTIDFFTVVFAYMIALDVIVTQPTGVSEGPALH